MDSRSHRIHFENMKDVFTLIYPRLTTLINRSAQRDIEERTKRLKTWLADMIEITAHTESSWCTQKALGVYSYDLLPHFMMRLRECILRHDWKCVLTIIDCLVHIPRRADWAIFKASLAALYSEPSKNIRLIQDFFSLSFGLGVFPIKLDCTIYNSLLEVEGENGVVQEGLGKIAGKHRNRLPCVSQKNFHAHILTLIDAYQRLIHYIGWKKAIHKTLRSTQDSSLPQQTTDVGIKAMAERALPGMASLVHQPGVWDIFVVKAVEIHEYYQDFAQARHLLQCYRDRNPDNPNAHRLLYQHIRDNAAYRSDHTAVEETLSCLKGVARLDPANPLVLELWKLLSKRSNRVDALTCLFDLLDYAIWKDREDGWNCLSRSFRLALSSDQASGEKRSYMDSVEELWSTRSDWWPRYHFSGSVTTPTITAPMTIGHLASCVCLKAKCIVAAVLIGPTCKYLEDGLHHLDMQDCYDLQEELKCLDLDFIAHYHDSVRSDNLGSILRSRSLRASVQHRIRRLSSSSSDSCSSSDRQPDRVVDSITKTTEQEEKNPRIDNANPCLLLHTVLESHGVQEIGEDIDRVDVPVPSHTKHPRNRLQSLNPDRCRLTVDSSAVSRISEDTEVVGNSHHCTPSVICRAGMGGRSPALCSSHDADRGYNVKNCMLDTGTGGQLTYSMDSCPEKQTENSPRELLFKQICRTPTSNAVCCSSRAASSQFPLKCCSQPPPPPPADCPVTEARQCTGLEHSALSSNRMDKRSMLSAIGVEGAIGLVGSHYGGRPDEFRCKLFQDVSPEHCFNGSDDLFGSVESQTSVRPTLLSSETIEVEMANKHEDLPISSSKSRKRRHPISVSPVCRMSDDLDTSTLLDDDDDFFVSRKRVKLER